MQHTSNPMFSTKHDLLGGGHISGSTQISPNRTFPAGQPQPGLQDELQVAKESTVSQVGAH